MAISRIRTIVLLLISIAWIMIYQYIAVAILEPVAGIVIEESDNLEKFGGAELINSMFATSVKWGPLVATIGVIVFAAAREYRRSRRSGTTPGVRRP